MKNIVYGYRDSLINLNIDKVRIPIQPPPHYQTILTNSDGKARLESFGKEVTECARLFNEAAKYSASIRMLTPVWAESFVNLLILFMVKPDFTSDKRLYDDFLRRNIDVRVKLFHLNCIGFEKAIDTDDNRFKLFHTMMNDRNDLLHANTDPEALSYEEMFFDGMIPLWNKQPYLGQDAIEGSLIGIPINESLNRIKIVEDFIALVLESLTDDIRKQVEYIINKKGLGWRPMTKRIGVLFDDFQSEGFLLP